MSLSDIEKQQMGKIFTLLVTSKAFKKSFLNDPFSAIDNNKNRLGFSSADTSPTILDMLASLSEQEIEALIEVRSRIGGESQVAGGTGVVVF